MRFQHMRQPTPLEYRVLRYISEHPRCNVEDVCNHFESEIDRSVTAHACGYLIADFWVDRNPDTDQLTVIEEVPS